MKEMINKPKLYALCFQCVYDSKKEKRNPGKRQVKEKTQQAREGLKKNGWKDKSPKRSPLRDKK